ncbi:MAG: ferrochelatase [Myxococcota bacterium]
MSLAQLDAQLQARAAFETLEPAAARAMLPSALAQSLPEDTDDDALREAFAEGLCEAVAAMLHAFPENLLWDLHALGAAQLRHARASEDPPTTVRHLWQRIAALQHAFGHHGPIRFRYIHDFIYGFDWAKWVAKNPSERRAIGPYDPAFVERMHTRGAELVTLIEGGKDAKYGPLQGPQARNPFGFSREPEAELALHRRLAASDALPVRAWDPGATPDWTRPYARLREEAADALRISA